MEMYHGNGKPFTTKDYIDKIVSLEKDLYNADGTKKTKTDVEFSRYKQDCRKRAMDLAHNEVNSPLAKKYAEQNEPLDILLVADKYYNWLISIPE